MKVQHGIFETFLLKRLCNNNKKKIIKTLSSTTRFIITINLCMNYRHDNIVLGARVKRAKN
jgi:hypothetical protein